MRVLEKRFLRGPSIYRMSPCFVLLLDLEDHQPFGINDLLRGSSLMRTLMADGPTAVIVGADEAARLLARLMAATQAWAGSPATLCDTAVPVRTAPGRYRMVGGYEHEAVAEEALRISVELLTALWTQQSFDVDARLVKWRASAAAGFREHVVQGTRTDPLLKLPRTARRGSGSLSAPHPSPKCGGPSDERRIPVIAVTGTNGKTTTTQLIAHVLRASGVRTGTTTSQGIYIDGQCVQTGDCSGYWSARRVLTDRAVDVATLETARGGILKRGLAFDRCDVGVVLNVTGDHLGLDGIETLQDLAHVKGLVARCAAQAAVLNADDALCVAMRETLPPGCKPVFFTMDSGNPVFLEHVRAGGSGACLDEEGWLVWWCAGERAKAVKAVDLPCTWQGRARYNIANALAAFAALRSLGCETALIAQGLEGFVSDAKSNPLRGNQFEIDGIKLIVDYAHNVVAYRALCSSARSMLEGAGRLVGVVTSPGDRRTQDLYETGQVCGLGFDELVVYEQDPRGRVAGATSQEILRGAHSVAPGKPLHGEPRIRHALSRGLAAARPGDLLVFTCAGSFDDLVEGVRLKSPAAADRIAHEVSR